MTDLRTAAQQALAALELIDKEFKKHGRQHWPEAVKARNTAPALRAALAEPVQEAVAWSHNLIDNIITHRPADIDRHPDRWTALYREPKPCPTCEALARTVMMDQTGYDTAPPQRKPLTDEEIEKATREVWRNLPSDFDYTTSSWVEVGIRYAERTHGIGE